MTRRIIFYVEEASTGAPLGDAFVSLEALRGGEGSEGQGRGEQSPQLLPLLDERQTRLGELCVEMCALKAVQAVVSEMER